MTPRYERAARGQRVVGSAPRNHGPNTTLIAAMGTAGITTAMTLERAINRDACDVFVGRGLVPTLHPGQPVILDTLSVHTSAHAIAAIEAADCRVVVLPPSSPDVAPIEQAIGRLTSFLRRVGPGVARPGGAQRRPDGRVGDRHRR